MTTDELSARLRALVAPGRHPTPSQVVGIAQELARPDVERGETHDQWLLLEVSDGGREVRLTRFFDFGDEGLPDLADVGAVLTVAAGTSRSTALWGAIHGHDDDDRVPTELWLAEATRVLTAAFEGVVATTEVFG